MGRDGEENVGGLSAVDVRVVRTASTRGNWVAAEGAENGEVGEGDRGGRREMWTGVGGDGSMSRL